MHLISFYKNECVFPISETEHGLSVLFFCRSNGNGTVMTIVWRVSMFEEETIMFCSHIQHSHVF